MGFGQRELTIIGHWSITSRMPERYDRSVCASELLLRNAIVQKMASGWAWAPAYHIPTTASGQIRIGEDPGPVTPTVTEAAEVATVAVNELAHPFADDHLGDASPPAPVADTPMGGIPTQITLPDRAVGNTSSDQAENQAVGLELIRLKRTQSGRNSKN